MALRLSVFTAICMSLAVTAMAAQAPSSTGAVGTSSTPSINPGELPIDVVRIGRQLRLAREHEERDGLKLRYSVDVYGQAPKIKLITPLDNLWFGNVAKTAPTSRDMMEQWTPQEFSSPVMSIYSIPRK